MNYKNIFDFIRTEESAYASVPVQVVDGYDWQMAEHIKKTVLYKNSRYSTGKDDNKPFKNIIRPILNLAYRAEGFDVKDIVLFVNDPKNYHKSFLVKKFHEKWARENGLDTFIDDMVEAHTDFGGVLVKNVNEIRPEVVPWQRVAFCDQTDVLSGPICEKHFYSPDQLKEMESKGWGNDANGATGTIQDVIELADEYKKDNLRSGIQIKTPGRYIEVYEVHGTLPVSWLTDKEDPSEESEKHYVPQLHIVTFYQKDGVKDGITLFRGKERKSPYKLKLRDKIYGRALGFGGAEELFEPQVWVNYDMIRLKGMLDAASKVIYQTADAKFANRNKTSNVESGEILIHEAGKPLTQVNTVPVNVPVFENAIKEWEAHAQQMGAANDAIMGESPTAGTPFKLQELVTAEAHSLHDYRKGQLATFLGEIYRDWVLPYISREIAKGQEFLSELDLDELQSVADSLVTCEANKLIIEKILNGEEIDPLMIDAYKEKVRLQFMKGGNKKFISILEGEMKSAPLDVEVNIVGKQKYLSALTDKLTNIFRQIIATPQILDDPRMAKIFNQILESSGLDPVDFYSPKPTQMMQQQPQMMQQPQMPMNQPAAQPAY